MSRSKPINVEQIDPAERKRIDRGIAKSIREYQQGLGIGPFASAQELVASLNEQAGKSTSRRRTAVTLGSDDRFWKLIAQRRKQKTSSRTELERRLDKKG